MPDLVTLTDAKAYLQSPDQDDARVSSLITQASGVVERYTGRQFITAAVTEQLDGGYPSLFVAKRPIVALTAITDTTTGDVTSTDDYVVYADQGQIVLLLGSWACGLRRWKVEYTAGYGTEAPADVQQAVLLLVAQRYELANASVTNEADGVSRAQYAPGMPPEVRKILSPYREVVI